MIARNYLRTWFIFDLLAALPIALLIRVIASTSGQEAAAAVKLLRLLRLGKVLNNLNLRSTAVDVSRIVLLFIAWCIFAHWYACFWWLFGITEDPNQDPPPWVYYYGVRYACGGPVSARRGCADAVCDSSTTHRYRRSTLPASTFPS